MILALKHVREIHDGMLCILPPTGMQVPALYKQRAPKQTLFGYIMVDVVWLYNG